MTFNWDFALQQLLMAVLAGGLCWALFAGLRKLGFSAQASPIRLWVELPTVAIGLYFIGATCRECGWGNLLPNLYFTWTVGIALTFYWMAAWWPLRVLLQSKHLRKHLAGKLTVAAAVISILGAIYSCFIEVDLLEPEPLDVVLEELGDKTIRIAHVSDTQLIALGPRENEVVEVVNAFEPHIVVFTGDYICGTAGEATSIAAMRSILERLRPTHGIFATPSDSDDEALRQKIFAGLPVHYMVNDNATVEVEGITVRVGSLDHFEPDWQSMARGSKDSELFIVACHAPDLAEDTRTHAPHADMYLCGHTHGGQVRIPFFGPPITMTTAPRHVASGGAFVSRDGMPYFVSRGVGTEGDYAPRFRFNCPPHLFLLTLSGTATPAQLSR